MDRAKSGARIFVIGLLSCVFAAIAFNGFYQKWGFNDGDPRSSLDRVLDGNAVRPWAFRRMVPDIANAIDRSIPAGLHARLADRLRTYVDYNMPRSLPKAGEPRYIIRYNVAYALTFLSGLFALASAYLLARRVGAPPLAAYLTGIMAILLVPLLQKGGGYFYDMPELGFFCLFAALCARPRGIWLAIPVAALATWNKESFLLFTPCAVPLMIRSLGVKRGSLLFLACAAISAAVYEIARLRFGGNPGVGMEFHAREQFQYLTSPHLLFERDPLYGVRLLPAAAALVLVALAFVVASVWRDLDLAERRHFQIAFVISLPLYVMVAGPGEFRNLSMLFPGVAMAIALCTTRLVRNAEKTQA